MKNWDKIRWNWSEWIYINWAYFINDEIDWNFKDVLNENLEDLYELLEILKTKKD
jgi:hypothetical protein